MLKVIPKGKPKRQARGCYEPLIQECVALLKSGRAKSASQAAWVIARDHAAEGISVNTLSDYLHMYRRFHVEPKQPREKP